MGMPKPAKMAMSILYGSKPRSTSRQAAWVYGKNTRFTAKPVQLPTTTGVFLMALPYSNVSSTTCDSGRSASDLSVSKLLLAPTPSPNQKQPSWVREDSTPQAALIITSFESFNSKNWLIVPMPRVVSFTAADCAL